jgi:hypothetical protein
MLFDIICPTFTSTGVPRVKITTYQHRHRVRAFMHGFSVAEMRCNQSFYTQAADRCVNGYSRVFRRDLQMLSQKRFSFHNGQYVGCSTLYLIMNIGVRSNPKAVRRMLVWSGTTDSLSALYSSLILTEGSQDAAIINSTQEAFKSHVSGYLTAHIDVTRYHQLHQHAINRLTANIHNTPTL